MIGVLVMQLVMLSQAYKFEKKEIGEKIHFALEDVVKKIYRDNNQTELPVSSSIKKISEDYYIVNVNDVFESDVLEFYLKKEFRKVRLNIDFEYAMYDCSSDEMAYGDYVSSSDKKTAKCKNCFTKNHDLVYYFAIRFPELKYNYISSLQQYWVYTGILVLVLIIYVYSILVLLRQKRYSELQKDFINNMTHEFKTPISSILIASQYASNQQEIIKNEKLNKYIQIIIEQGNKLNQHIEKILSVAKSDSDPMELELVTFNSVETIQLVRENILMKYQRPIHITIQSDYPVHEIAADEFHFTNVVYNIMDNAVKYNDSVPEITITIHETPKELIFEFRDNGIGITASELGSIFDKFYRAATPKRNEVAGFGLGLFYVKKICNLHQWKISLKNNSDQGVTVTIRMPKNK